MTHPDSHEQQDARKKEQDNRSTPFLASLAHDLRSPLNTINGYLDLVLAGHAGELNPQQYEFILRARSGTEHLYTLLENVLLLARYDAGQLRLQLDSVRLLDIVEDAVSELESTTSDQHIALTIAIPKNIPFLNADRIRLQQVVRNLITNALNHTPENGSITISALLVSDPSLVSSGLDNQNHHVVDDAHEDEEHRFVQLTISDTGSGIPAIYHERIFERSFQIRDGEQAHPTGRGLGLAVAKLIIELHGGSISVKNSDPAGATFICMLPCL
jgi:signal transduction histidine kinase